MEMTEWAERILSADTLDGKLIDPGKLLDNKKGPAIFWDSPTRPAGMEMGRRTKSEKLPSLQELSNPDKRAICLHRFAGHELLAVEMMAYALLAFPEAPTNFRRGLSHTLKEEQEHVRLYQAEMAKFGVSLGDQPLYRHFWALIKDIRDPLQFVSTMNLTLEMANLDFAPMYGAAFSQHGDDDSAALMAQILQDEIAHVRFGFRWLEHFKSPNASSWNTWIDNLGPLIQPRRAKGKHFNRESRQKAGIPDDWIECLSKE